MNISKFTSTVLIQLQAWREELEPADINTTPLPIIAVPPDWMEKSRLELGAVDENAIGQIWGCEVLVDENVEHPVIIRHDGKTVVLDREWRGDIIRLLAAKEKRKRVAERRLKLVK